MEYRRGVISASLTAFANRLSDAIANVTLAQGPGTFPGVGFVPGSYQQRENVRAISVHGIEASAEATRGPWSVRFGASDTDARVVADGLAGRLNGLRPAQTPKFVLSGALAWDSRGRSVAIEFRRTGSQFEDDLNLRRIRSATTIDASVAWPVGKGVELVLRGENLLNETVIAGLNDDGSVERATPRTLWIGIRVGQFD